MRAQGSRHRDRAPTQRPHARVAARASAELRAAERSGSTLLVDPRSTAVVCRLTAGYRHDPPVTVEARNRIHLPSPAHARQMLQR